MFSAVKHRYYIELTKIRHPTLNRKKTVNKASSKCKDNPFDAICLFHYLRDIEKLTFFKLQYYKRILYNCSVLSNIPHYDYFME